MSVVNIRVSATRGNEVLAVGDFTCEVSAERFYDSLQTRYWNEASVTINFMVSSSSIAA